MLDHERDEYYRGAGGAGNCPPFIKGEGSGAVTPRWLGGIDLLRVVGIEEGLVFKHGAGDVEPRSLRPVPVAPE